MFHITICNILAHQLKCLQCKGNPPFSWPKVPKKFIWSMAALASATMAVLVNPHIVVGRKWKNIWKNTIQLFTTNYHPPTKQFVWKAFPLKEKLIWGVGSRTTGWKKMQVSKKSMMAKWVAYYIGALLMTVMAKTTQQAIAPWSFGWLGFSWWRL